MAIHSGMLQYTCQYTVESHNTDIRHIGITEYRYDKTKWNHIIQILQDTLESLSKDMTIHITITHNRCDKTNWNHTIQKSQVAFESHN